jgi:hypothetical protein
MIDRSAKSLRGKILKKAGCGHFRSIGAKPRKMRREERMSGSKIWVFEYSPLDGFYFPG